MEPRLQIAFHLPGLVVLTGQFLIEMHEFSTGSGQSIDQRAGIWRVMAGKNQLRARILVRPFPNLKMESEIRDFFKKEGQNKKLRVLSLNFFLSESVFEQAMPKWRRM